MPDIAVVRHHIEDNDEQNFKGQARCSCGWRVSGVRNLRLAAAYRHIADELDPPTA